MTISWQAAKKACTEILLASSGAVPAAFRPIKRSTSAIVSSHKKAGTPSIGVLARQGSTPGNDGDQSFLYSYSVFVPTTRLLVSRTTCARALLSFGRLTVV